MSASGWSSAGQCAVPAIVVNRAFGSDGRQLRAQRDDPRQIVFTRDDEHGYLDLGEARPRGRTFGRVADRFGRERPTVHVDHQRACRPLHTTFGLLDTIQPVADLEPVDLVEVACFLGRARSVRPAPLPPSTSFQSSDGYPDG